MDIKILHSWLSEYLQTDAKPLEIGRCLALCGPSVEKVEKWGNSDWIYSIEVTTNRVDMMSVYGIAREAAVILPQFGHKAKLKTLPKFVVTRNTLSLPLQIKTDAHLTSRVMAQIMTVKTPISSTPQWMKERLEAADIRSLNLLVDITNYVMLEVGHPTHVFDYDRIKTHKLIFRPSKKGEKITTLDDKTYTLQGGDSVIDDGTGTIIDLPGIMGTANSVVTNDTKTIIFFIDDNNAKLMRQTSMQHGIRTNAVTLNEKHVSPELATVAMQRGIQLYQELAGAKIVAKLIDIYDKKPKQKSITVSLQFVENRLGVKLDPKFVINTLQGLGFITTKVGNKDLCSLQIKIPYWRIHDIAIPEDIVEEVARIYGYHNLPSILPTGELPKPNPLQEQFSWEQKIKSVLKHWGYWESYSYSLVSRNFINPYNLKIEDHLKLKNPLTTDWEYLRSSLITSILGILELNQSKKEMLNFFELANIYLPQKQKLPEQKLHLTLATTEDFLNIKGILEALCEELGIVAHFEPLIKSHWFDDIKAASLIVNNETIGSIGQLKTKYQTVAKINKPISLADLDFGKLIARATKNKTYTPIPKYPPIVEQYTFINEDKVTAAKILDTANKVDKLINQITIIGTYENKISIEVTYLDKDKNLSDTEIAKIRKKLVDEIEKLGMKLEGEI